MKQQNKTKESTEPEKAVGKRVLCKQLAPPPLNSIFLSLHTSWLLLISPQCPGIATFLEATVSAFADDSPSLGFLKKV